MGIPDYTQKENTLIICIENDHGNKAKKGDFKMVYDRIAHIYTRLRREVSQTAKWRLATPFEAEAYYNGAKRIKPLK